MTHRTRTPNSATKPVMSILAAERMAGYREGLRTISQVLVVEAHEEGRIRGFYEAKSNCYWWNGFYFLSGFAVFALFYGLVLS